MSFYLLTNFIEPIDKKIVLSSNLNYYFDNPKTEDEINEIKSLLTKAWLQSEISDTFAFQRMPLSWEVDEDLIATYEQTIEKLLQKKTRLSNKAIKRQMDWLRNNKEGVIEFFAKNWVIVRFDNIEMKEEEKRLKVEHEKFIADGWHGFFMLEDEHIFEKRQHEVVSFCQLLALLTYCANDSDYEGKGFLFTEYIFQVKEYFPNLHYLQQIYFRTLSLYSREDDPSLVLWDFKIFYEKAKCAILLLEKSLTDKQADLEKIIYIWDSLKSISTSESEYSRLLGVISLIEMLLTHQPDFHRFNVEDSIAKQFILKTAIVVYGRNKNLSLNEVKDKLKILYKQRSNIAHGNFSQLKSYKNTLKEDEYFSDLISDAYFFLKNVIEEHLEDAPYMDYLKEN